MSGLTTVPLRAFELARYAVPVPCYVCSTENRFDNAFCSQCHAPLELNPPTDKKHSAPQLVTVLGGPGVGKTCYLGLLTDMLSRNSSGIQLFARGAFSVSLQQQTMSALARRQFPPATPADPMGWQWVHGTVRSRRNKHPVELILPDVSGAAILGEIESPRSVPAVRRLLAHGVAAMILIDADRLASGIQDSEFAALKIIGDLMSAAPSKKGKSWADRAVAFLFTKADRCDWALDAPEEFARRHAPALWRQCREQLHRHHFFAVSVASAATGVDAYGERLNIPLRIEPRGVIEPFAWVVDQLHASPERR
jgi:hypothetical protein